MNEEINSKEELKRRAACEAASLVEDGMKVGLGTGSTANYFIERLGRRVTEEGLKIEAIATSSRSEELARKIGIPIMSSFPTVDLDITVDGADEIDPKLNLIKGLGGALLIEKIIAKISRFEVIIADEGKLVKRLGEKSPIPVEVIQFGWEGTLAQFSDMGLEPKLRLLDDNSSEPFQTNQGNLILDCFTKPLEDPEIVAREIKSITGVVDHGLFINLAQKAIIAYPDRIGILEI